MLELVLGLSQFSLQTSFFTILLIIDVQKNDYCIAIHMGIISE